MRTVTIQCQDNEIFIDGFTKRTKCLNLCVKITFWIHPAAIETGAMLPRSSAFMLLLGNTRRGGTYVTVAFMQVIIVTSEPSLLKTDTSLTL